MRKKEEITKELIGVFSTNQKTVYALRAIVEALLDIRDLLKPDIIMKKQKKS